MEADFDPEDRYSWFFGMLSRDRANTMLQNQDHSGCFLVRESNSIAGDYVLCVKEVSQDTGDSKVSHYIINREQSSDGLGRATFKIGEKRFADIPSLLNFYKTHLLDTTTLIRPAPRAQLLCKYDFGGRDPEDLPFRRGDILFVISEDEEEWWTARNSNGQVGQIPVRYTELIDNNQSVISQSPQRSEYQPPTNRQPPRIPETQLPAKAVVVLQRSANAYDRTQLSLRVGDIVTVTQMNLNGQWRGTISDNGTIKEGIFPFTHVRILTPEELLNLPGGAD